MRTLKLCLVMVAVVTMAMSALAQMGAPQGTIVQIYDNVPKPGMSAQYEAGRKRHMAWHKAQKDTWTWLVWEVMSGENTGSYTVGTFNHQWKDFDREKFDASDTANAGVNLAPYQASNKMSFWTLRRDLSLTAGELNAPYLTVTHYFVKPDGLAAFVDAVAKVGEAIKKTNYPAKPSQWYMLVNGGEGPHFVLVTARNNFADMQLPDKSITDVVKEAYGEEGGAKILATLAKSYHRSETEMLKLRLDLSYNPAAK